MTTLVQEKPVVETSPPERWKNRYLATIGVIARCGDCGTVVDMNPGDEFLMACCLSFPSREAAEKHDADNMVALDNMRMKYLGPIRL